MFFTLSLNLKVQVYRQNGELRNILGSLKMFVSPYFLCLELVQDIYFVLFNGISEHIQEGSVVLLHVHIAMIIVIGHWLELWLKQGLDYLIDVYFSLLQVLF